MLKHADADHHEQPGYEPRHKPKQCGGHTPAPGHHASMRDDYLERILKARIYDVAEETPLDPAPRLSARLGTRVLLKREDLPPVFSCKIRGAYNRIAQLSPAEQAARVICSSAGNHAQGTVGMEILRRHSQSTRGRCLTPEA